MEVPKDVLPGSSQVQEETVKTPKVETPVETQKEQTVEDTAPVLPKTPEVEAKGSKTPETNLYAALEEERKKRKELEAQIYQLSSEPQVQEAFSDEGKLLEKKIVQLQGELDSIKEEKIVEALYTQYPELKELSSEFSSFRSEYPSTKVENTAKLFLMEKGLLGIPRKGLEKPSSSSVAPVSSGLTAEEVADLRKHNHRKYTEMLMSGKIRLDELK